jgi:hypothetical protein
MERLLDGLPDVDWNVFSLPVAKSSDAAKRPCGTSGTDYACSRSWAYGMARWGKHRRWIMIRELFVAAAITGAVVGLAPVAVADPGNYDGDVPGINYDASLGAPCDNYERFIFGRGPGGQAEACHFIINQFPAAQSGYWVITYPLYGVQQVGAKCDNPRGASAQSPDGQPMLCTDHGWQIGQRTGGGAPNGAGGGFPSDTSVTN